MTVQIRSETAKECVAASCPWIARASVAVTLVKIALESATDMRRLIALESVTDQRCSIAPVYAGETITSTAMEDVFPQPTIRCLHACLLV